MYFLQLSAFIILLFMHKSHSLPEGFCNRAESQQILRICTEDRMQDATTAYIDTFEASKFRNTSCECHILPSSHYTILVFKMIIITQGSPLKFEIKGKVLDKKTSAHIVRIEENTKLKFITQTTRKQEGACLAIYPRKPSQEGTFSINCKNVVTTTTTTGTMPVSNSTSQMTETMSSLSSISKSHTFSTKKQKSTAQTKVGPENTTDNGSSGIKVPIVAACIAAFICSAGFVILIVIICRRFVL
ncbi:uncharacterized protein LOC132738886 [Ruditapes philippinarum]|uniref:uncharacterized protein LOC132738886 n=1 Tax=Ruditapes philippinarum TaxID=129788 RepID=UPI00295AFCBD|nr:uncharacterized protein LOC132738886 [Ruditapes philippinarum]